MKVFIIGLVLVASASFGQIPDGYYDDAMGLSGQALREALMEIIDDHQEQSYASIWTHFQSTDDHASGRVWDMYSDIPGGNPAYTYTFIEDQCGNYSSEGDCYNREHSFPKSWFDNAAPMNTDIFHIYPTDGFVNGQRSNFPYGEVGSVTWMSTNGSKVGNSSYSGYAGVVFEPVDEYKGDFARTYFYMMTRYMNLVAGWSSDMLDGGDLSTWARELLLEWDENDPVSQKETERNDAVFQVQLNRNPFIDHPEFTGLIWGEVSHITDFRNQHIKLWYSNGTIHIENPYSEIGRLIITDLTGSLRGSWMIDSDYADITLNLQNGVYIVVLDKPFYPRNIKFVVMNN